MIKAKLSMISTERGIMRPVRINHLTLKNIGPFDDAQIDFPQQSGKGELVLFEGPNGCGKTTILQAIACLIAESSTIEAPVSLHRTRLRDKSDVSMTVEDSKDGVPVPVKKDVNKIEPKPIRSVEEPVAHRLLRNYTESSARQEPLEWAAFMYRPSMDDVALTATAAPPHQSTAYSPVDGALSGGRSKYKAHNEFRFLLHGLYTDELRHLGAAQKCNEDGDAPSELRHRSMARSKRLAYEKLGPAMSSLLEREVGFNFDRDTTAVSITIDGKSMPSELLGDGTKSTLLWLLDLLFRLHRIKWANEEISPWDQEFWLLLDEIETSLHPSRQRQIVPAIRSLFPNAHIYIATHSPFVVASAGEGTVFSIRPGQDHMVRGEIKPCQLEHGQSLGWTTENVFGIQSEFMDKQTVTDLATHEDAVAALEQDEEIDWDNFLACRGRLLGANAHVSTVALMRELQVRKVIAAKANAQGGTSTNKSDDSV